MTICDVSSVSALSAKTNYFQQAGIVKAITSNPPYCLHFQLHFGIPGNNGKTGSHVYEIFSCSTHRNIHKWALIRENWSLGFANNKGADQTAHPHSLVSTFLIGLFESIISRLAANEILLF